MTKIKFRSLFLTLAICLFAISAFASEPKLAHQEKSEKTILKVSERKQCSNQELALSGAKPTISLNFLNQEYSNELVSILGNDSVLKNQNQKAAGPVIALACYVACRAMGGSVSVCIAACTLPALL